jgi:hypothetical protein
LVEVFRVLCMGRRRDARLWLMDPRYLNRIELLELPFQHAKNGRTDDHDMRGRALT